ncbi:hypothetical protein [uncultured Chitinophaga sp.]
MCQKHPEPCCRNRVCQSRHRWIMVW